MRIVVGENMSITIDTQVLSFENIGGWGSYHIEERIDA
jgi:hypothetical protein